MTKKQTDRVARLLPGGVPRYVRIYDAPEYSDRFTVVFTGAAVAKQCGGEHPYLSLTAAAGSYHGGHKCAVDCIDSPWPPAIGCSCHLGKRIRFSDLPKDCQTAVLNDYKYYWSIE